MQYTANIQRFLYVLQYMIVISLILSSPAYAQEIKPMISVDISQLPPNVRDDITTLQSDVLNYLRTQRFTANEWEGPKVPIDATIFVLNGNQTSRRYTGRLLFNSRVNLDGGVTSPVLKIFDQQWTFPYTLNQQFVFQQLKYDEFSTLLDFYTFIALGLDGDTFEELSGTQYYEQAQQLCLLGASRNGNGYTSIVNEQGEFTRISLVTELMSTTMRDFRKLIFSYHADGMNHFAKDPEKARGALAEVLQKMADFKQKKLTSRSYLMQVFFDAKSSEISTVFQGTNNNEVFKNVQYLDPGNSSVYESSIMGR